MEITGADVDVTFIDLPGIISNTKEDRLIDLSVDSYVFSRRISHSRGHLNETRGSLIDNVKINSRINLQPRLPCNGILIK
jgi:hypothetical protein